ncbi:MAG: hypothetical protein IKS10_03935 [Lachnospiraceae bacterium]|nr:hypothetical protein [Lachnospiraceae bacterium]
MTIHITKDSLMDYISEIRDAFILEAEYTEEELKRLNAPEIDKTVGSSAVNENANTKDERIREYFPTQADDEDDEPEMQPTAAPKRKVANIIWITMGVALAAAAILLFVFLWNPDRSDVVTTTESTEMREPEVGDYLTFGSYEQDNNSKNGKEAIEWQVLAKEGDRILVISRYGLDCQPYHTEGKDVTWEECSLRTWLNNEFYKAAFSSKEKKSIQTSMVIAETGSEGAPIGNDTKDKLFLLTFDEVAQYFNDDYASVCQGTPYCYAQGAVEETYPDMEKRVEMDSYCGWWLRSPGLYGYPASFITYAGFGWDYANKDGIAVRPAMWIQSASYNITGSAGPTKLISPGLWKKTSIETVKISDAKVGDYVTFGSYEQDNDLENGKEAIEWQVLAREAGRMLVISRYGLDCVPYHSENVAVTWENCSLRQWLNSTFMDTAFASKEKDTILTSTVVADANPEYGTPAGNDTTDKIFLLSTDELFQYFAHESDRECLGTPYSEAQGAYIHISLSRIEAERNHEGSCDWLLRTPGQDPDTVSYVFIDGRAKNYGTDVGKVNNRYMYAVRPAMWIAVDDSGSPSETTSDPSETTVKTVEFRDAKAGDYIAFGSYEQDSNLKNGTEAIEWLVLDRVEDKLLVLSRYGLDCQPMDATKEDVPWETGPIRNWLNSSFYETAFNTEEKNIIANSTVKAAKKAGYDSLAGNDTIDHVFLLSMDEVDRYYDSDVTHRITEATRYCNRQGAYEDANGNTAWMLRSADPFSPEIAYVDKDGTFNYASDSQCKSISLRPAMWIDLNATDPQQGTSPAPVETPEKTPLSSDIEVGDFIVFGSYEQDGNISNREEAIGWLVLDKQEDRILVISRYGLDCQPYNNQNVDVTWETCSLRKWLNNEFYMATFTTEERSRILETTVTADKNPEHDTPAGNDTVDRVFLLSIEEVNRYFTDPIEAARCMGTPYCYNEGAYEESWGCCHWWLRTPGSAPNSAVHENGLNSTSNLGMGVSYDAYAVRPAMWIQIGQ